MDEKGEGEMKDGEGESVEKDVKKGRFNINGGMIVR